MFVQISWTACFKKFCFTKLLLSLTHSMTSLLSLAPAALGALRSLPFPLCIHSASRRSTSNQMVLMFIHIAALSSPSFYLIANGSSVILARKTYPLRVQCLKMHYLGCSYGYLIFSYKEQCLLVDVYTGTKVMPPKLPRNNDLGCFCGIGILTAPLISPNSRLLLFSRESMFEWQVGTNSWSEHTLTLDDELIYQIVFFKGDIFVIDVLLRLHTIHLTPQFSMQEIKIKKEFVPINSWLVVCDDMLLTVDQSFSGELGGSFDTAFRVFRLNLSVEPAKWVKLEKLENYALFVSLDRRNPTFCCMGPERWGGKSNCIYFARLYEDPDETWTAVEFGQPVPDNAVKAMFFYDISSAPDCGLLSSLWVFPSLVYGSG